MVGLLPEDTELLGGLELGGVPIATVLTPRTGCRRCSCASRPRSTAPASWPRAPDVAGRRVTLVEDVITTGGAVRDATRALREAGAIVTRSSLRDRPQPGGSEPPGRRRPRGAPGADQGAARRRHRCRAAADVRGRGVRRGRCRRRPGRAVRWCRHHSKTIGTTENARITKMALSMFSPSARERLAEEVAQQGDAPAPTARRRRRSRGRTCGGASAVDPGDDGDVGAHERHEAADHQRLAAVLVEERRGLVEVLPLQDAAVALVERWPDRAADLVAEDVAAEGGRRRAPPARSARSVTWPPGTRRSGRWR